MFAELSSLNKCGELIVSWMMWMVSTYEGTLQIPLDEVSEARPLSTQSDLYFDPKYYESCFFFSTTVKQFALIEKLEGKIENNLSM